MKNCRGPGSAVAGVVCVTRTGRCPHQMPGSKTASHASKPCPHEPFPCPAEATENLVTEPGEYGHRGRRGNRVAITHDSQIRDTHPSKTARFVPKIHVN